MKKGKGEEMREPEPKPFVMNRSRHRFGKQPPLPPWMSDKRYWLMFAVLTLLIGIPLGFLGSGPKTRTFAPSELASLSAVYGPSRTWNPSSKKHLREIVTKIHNNGPAAAELVDVQVTVNGKSFRLNGPDTISPGDTADYAGEGEAQPDRYATINLHLSCLNCSGSSTE